MPNVKEYDRHLPNPSKYKIVNLSDAIRSLNDAIRSLMDARDYPKDSSLAFKNKINRELKKLIDIREDLDALVRVLGD